MENAFVPALLAFAAFFIVAKIALALLMGRNV